MSGNSRNDVRIVECPRDAWQGFARQIPASVKAGYLRALVAAGFRQVDAVSFVSPKAVPQMADSEEVLRLLGPVPGVEIIGIVMNERGALRAQACATVTTVGFPYSLSATFAMRNQRQSLPESVDELRRIISVGLGVTVYLSMAFGNPYGDAWSVEEVVRAAEMIAGLGVRSISLADTVGLADAKMIGEVCRAVTAVLPDLEIGAHLHGLPEDTDARVRAAYDGGCRRFDAALGGFGGCPFAQDDRVGNLDTVRVLDALGLGSENLAGMRARAVALAAEYA